MFVWRYLDAHEQVAGTSEPFQDQDAAEAWLSAEWERLSQRGIAEVELFDNDTEAVIYRMSLEPETA